jgi:glycosyltransferase involved in cell wall biosynthesis
MGQSRPKNSLLLVGTWINRNCILGNWIKEIQSRNPKKSKIWWVASVFAGKHAWERFFHFPLPNYAVYYFSYPSIFESYFFKKPQRYKNKSIVNYTHNMDELGSLQHQAQILNNAFAVHFNCSRDAENLILHGLDSKKIRIVFGAIDEDCKATSNVLRLHKTVVLASKFGSRKGLEVLPEVVEMLSDWNFLILGRGWEDFLTRTGLITKPNIQYQFFNRTSRNEFMGRAKIFLNLSNLEGGPIPLIESMSLGCIPVATDTGFARDFITQEINGILLPTNPTANEVVQAILKASKITGDPREAVRELTWDRIAQITFSDFENVLTRKKDG